MATNLELDDRLIKEAMKWGKHKTKREAVTKALEEYIRIKNLAGWDELIGQLDYFEKLNATSNRRGKGRGGKAF